jgi:hypothetical protein
MRCQDCNKFVSHELRDDVEEDVSLQAEDGTADIDVRLVLECNDCGVELAEYNETATIEFAGMADHLAANPDHEMGEVSVDVEVGDYYMATDRNGKPIKSFRYRKHMYTAALHCEVECSCGERFEGDKTVEAQGSSFDQF